MTPTVTRVTGGAAAAETLSAQDYRDIYDELRHKCALRQFAETISSGVSFAWWSKYERDESMTLPWARRNELRRAVGLPELPPEPGAVLATATVDPDARVWQVGQGAADHVVMVGQDVHEPMLLRLNGDLGVCLVDNPSSGSPVTSRTAPQVRSKRASIHLSVALAERLSEARKTANMTWEAFITDLLDRSEHGDI